MNLCLSLRCDEPTMATDKYGNVTLIPFFRDEIGNKRYPVFGRDDHPLELADLAARCQIDGRMGSESYGWSVQYRNLYSVDLGSANRILKTLRTIDRRMDKMIEREGQPQSFGQFVNRFMRAIGASIIVDSAKNETQWSLREAAYIVDTRVAEIREQSQALERGERVS
jgi:hypothetical protein